VSVSERLCANLDNGAPLEACAYVENLHALNSLRGFTGLAEGLLKL
jgi:hypothetical protein